MANTGNDGTYPKGRFTRRQVIKAGGIAALGLAFSKPAIESLHPRPVWAQVSPDITSGGTKGVQPFSATIAPIMEAQIRSDRLDPNNPVLSPGVLGIFRGDLGIRGRGLLFFDLSSIPSGAMISSATISMISLPSLLFVPGITLHQILVPSGFLGTLPSWNNSTVWNDMQLPHNPTEEDTGTDTTSPTDQLVETTFVVTSLVQGWVDGAIANNGVIFKAGDETVSKQQFFFSINNIGFTVPKLDVSGFTGGGGEEH